LTRDDIESRGVSGQRRNGSSCSRFSIAPELELPCGALLDDLMTVFVYVNTSKQVGDPDHIKVFATAGAAATWFEENDLEGVAFEYEVLG